MKKEITIRFANIADLPFIVDIYNQAIRSGISTGHTKEFSVDERIDWFNKFSADKYPIYVAIKENKVIGYATLSPFREGRKAMQKIAEISFFVDSSFQNSGVGSALMDAAISDCERFGKETLLAFLLDINPHSISLLKKFSFEEWGRLPGAIDFGNNICDHLTYGRKL